MNRITENGDAQPKPRPDAQRHNRSVATMSATPHRATVVGILQSGEILVEYTGCDEPVVCDYLQTAQNDPVILSLDDEVLIAPPSHAGGKGCVLGKVGRYRVPDRRRVELAADEELSLKCGDSTITIRATGQILLNGKDIVSQAKRCNRIRGGSIQLN